MEISSTVARERDPGAAAVQRLVLSCDFEGVVAWIVGLDEQRPCRASTLEQPPRLVVDIATVTARQSAENAPD